MFASHAPILRVNGWSSVIPIVPGQKRPAIGGWQQFNIAPPPDELIGRWASQFPNHGVGLAYGPDAVIAVDVDQLDQMKSAEMEKIVTDVLGPSPLIRVGRPPKFLALYSAAPSVHLDGKNFGGFEIFATSGQTVLFGRHPDGFDYTWRDATPLDLSPADLPIVTQEMLKGLIDRLTPYRVALVGRKGVISTTVQNDRTGSGAAAAVLPILRAAADPIAEAAAMVSNAGEGARYHTAFGCVVALAMMGHADQEIRDALFQPYAALFDPADAPARLSALETGLRWVRRQVGMDAIAAASSPVMKSLAAAWEDLTR